MPSTYVQDIARHGVDVAAYEAAALRYPPGKIPAGPWTKGLDSYARVERDRPLVPLPQVGPWAHEMAFQREMIAEYKNALSAGETSATTVMRCPSTGKPLTRKDVMNQYAVLLIVCAEKLGDDDA